MIWHTNSHHHIRWSFLKAAALRLSTFWNFELRAIFSAYIAYLLRSHSAALKSPKTNAPKDMFTWEQVFSVYKSDEEIVHLYFTNESACASNLARLKSLSILKDFPCAYNFHAAKTNKEEGRQEEEDGSPPYLG
jgi:hypothetical protein